LHRCILTATPAFIDYYASFFIWRKLRHTLTQGEQHEQIKQSRRCSSGLSAVPDHWLRLGCGTDLLVVSMSDEPALEAAIEFMDDLLSPECYGHAIPSDAHTRALVVRIMLKREYNRRMQARNEARPKTNL
jgi:hypothetical protein